MKKIIVIAVAALLAMLEAIMIVEGTLADTEAPIIRIYQNRIEYSIGCPDEAIIQGVEAHDGKDGDVSSTAEIVSRSVIVQNRLETVEISACDKSGNVAATKVIFVVEDDNTYKILDYKNYKMDMENLSFVIDGAGYSGQLEKVEEDTEASSEDDSSKSEGESGSGDADDKENPTKEEPTEAETPTGETPTERPTPGADGKPVIIMKYNETEVAVGAGNAVYINAVEDIVDDKDAREYLFTRIGITTDINLNVPGDYEQGLFSTDSDGNVSEVAKLIIHVK